MLGILRQPAITVGAGVTEAAVLHLRSLVARLRLANRELHQAERKLDELCTALSETTAAAQDSGPGDATILRSLPGVGPVTLAILLTEAAGPIARRDYAALRTLSGVAPVTKRSGKSCIVVMRYAAQVRLRNAVFHWARVAVLNDPSAAAAMPPYGRAGTPMAVPCGASVTDCSGWPASCSNGGCYSTPTMVRPPPRRLQRSRRLTLSLPRPALQQSAARKCCPGGRERPRRQAPARSVLCAGHVQQPGGESPLCNLMEVKHERSARAEPRGTV